MEKIARAIRQGKLAIGEFQINCAVVNVDNEPVRVVSERSIAKAFGIKGGGAYWKKKKSGEGSSLPEYISAQYLNEFVDDELRARLTNPIKYTAITKKLASGIEAIVLPEICNVWISAEKKGALTTDMQKEIAERAYILMRGFANLGIIALVDEATGFQEIRDKLALQKILDKYLLKEYAKWAKRFPDEFYELMFRLNGWNWNGLSVSRPGVVGKYTNDLVYQRLAPGLLTELRKINPPNEQGNRKSKHHQWLTDEIGHPALQKHLAILIAFMRAAPNWGAFHRMVERALPKLGETIPLALEEKE